MNGLHGCGTFLAVIVGKRFMSTGLNDVVVEAHFLGLESVNQILNCN